MSVPSRPASGQPLDPNSDAFRISYKRSSSGLTEIWVIRLGSKAYITYKYACAIRDALQVFENDPSQKICKLHIEGGLYSTVYNFSYVQLENPEGDNTDSEPRASSISHIDRVDFIKKPVIVTVKGCINGGLLELTLLGDFVVSLVDTFYDRFIQGDALPLFKHTPQRLQAKIGLGHASCLYSMFTTTAVEALGMGLIQEIHQDGASLDSFLTPMVHRYILFYSRISKARAEAYAAAYRQSCITEVVVRDYNLNLDGPVLGEIVFAEDGGWSYFFHGNLMTTHSGQI